MTSVTEKLLEDEISRHLVSDGGYRICKIGIEPEWRQDFDATVGLDTVELFAFIELTQGSEWGTLSRLTAARRGWRAGSSSNAWRSRSTSEGPSMSYVMGSATRTSRFGSPIASPPSGLRRSWSPTTTPTG